MAESRSRLILIYGLIDPRTDCLRYIGQSKRLSKRFWRHCHPVPKDRSHCGCWLRGLRNAGLIPQLVELEEAQSRDEAAIFESFWIASLRAAGANLVNTTAGELAPSRRGFTLSSEHRAKIAASHVGIRPNEATRAKLRAARKNYQWSAATRAKIAATQERKFLHPKPIKHGTTAAYQRGCRCNACTQAILAYGKLYRRRKTAKRPPSLPSVPTHGTAPMYWRGCRCSKCKRAVADYAMKRKQLRKAA